MADLSNKLQRAFEFLNKGSLKQAEILYLECLDRIDDPSSTLYKQALHGLAYVKSELNQYTEANELYSELLRRARQESDSQNEAIAYHQLGLVQRMAGNYEAALGFFAEELAIYDTFRSTPHLGFAANLYEQAMVHLGQENLTEAQRLMEEALDNAEKTDDFIVIGSLYRGLGDIYQQIARSDEAKKHYRNAANAYRQANDLKAVEEIERKLEGV
ncbi:Tetratricopeptide repeat-containing protein [Lentibacillus persicus]|uniref:Tetratricopeptide repeat-containing protein n=1 Tax=Lentibacillus persicus TaxID=640948 RepID=A0A1I1ZZS4_9BACI|nr:tetratricopeptide repeat protein [Lentibacillus persicus]SFE37195.1 Tetratricopeptide repeat-containing protein [Lentibacillus persicus]